jgi:hypothetical protein
MSLDGEDLLSMGLETLRTRLTIIPQDPVMFSGGHWLYLNTHVNTQDSHSITHTWLLHQDMQSYANSACVVLNH